MRVAARFEASLRTESNVAIIDLEGDVDGDAEESLNAAYEQARSNGPSTILLNFRNVEYINSTGIALIVGLLAQARKAHQSIVASGLSDHYREIFQITRLVDFMGIYPDEATALAESPSSNQ
jgi:anti-sigma B factor antagonist